MLADTQKPEELDTNFSQLKTAENQNIASEFMELIAKDWKGTAVLTPVGPVDYNLKLTKVSATHVTGAADLGRAIHYWNFYRHIDTLKLKFLTTFAGNTKPINFKLHRYSNEGFEFKSTSREDVKVIFKAMQNNLAISIFLNDKAHVKIELYV